MLSGIEHFSEISIVNRGAATHAKILQEKRTTHYSEEELRKLAASAKKADLCVATFTNKLEKKMTVEKTNEILLDEKIAALEAENAQLKQSLDLAEKVKDLEGKLEASYTKVAELTETLAKAEEEKEAAVAEKTAEIETLKNEKAEQETKLSGAMDFIKAEVQKVLVASGEANLSIPEDLDGIANLLAERQQMLASLIPAGGVSATAKTKNNAELIAGYTEAQLKAFQVKK
jgi:dGTP triphosphohydrolase